MNWDEDDKRKTVQMITVNKKHLERLLMLVAGTGVAVGVAVYANLFAPIC
jgi:hypothetical protein